MTVLFTPSPCDDKINLNKELMFVENDLLHQILSELMEMKLSQQEMQSDIKGLKSDVTSLKSDVSTLKTDVSEVKTKVTTIEKDVKYLRLASEGAFEDIGKLEKRIEAIN